MRWGRDLILYEVEFFVDGGFSEVECVFKVIVGIDCVIVFFDMSLLTSSVEFLEVR